MTALFWLSLAAIVYVYAGYPALLYAWARLRPRAVAAADQLPGVSIILAVRNEGARIGARLDNLLGLDYPAAARQIIVAVDGATDHTLEVLNGYNGLIDIVVVPPGGKALALNAGVARARFDVLAFADARQVFAADALRQLTAPFADPQVGGVTGELRLDCEDALFSNRRALERRHGGAAAVTAASGNRRCAERRNVVSSAMADGVGLYWHYEKRLRSLESRVGSTLGATGAIYAIRRSLWRPLPAGTILDDVLVPMRVVMAGSRVVFNEQARAFDRAAPDGSTESRRKVRTLAGNYQIFALEPRLLLPWANPVWFQYMSHKVGRLVVPYAMLSVFLASVVLAGSGVFYQAALGVQVAFLLLAGYGAFLEFSARRESPAYVRHQPPAAAQVERAARGAA